MSNTYWPSAELRDWIRPILAAVEKSAREAVKARQLNHEHIPPGIMGIRVLAAVGPPPAGGDAIKAMRDQWDVDMHAVLAAAEGLADIRPNAPPWAGELFLRVAGMLDEARLQGHRYRRGMRRLVGSARCSECQTHKPALTCFDNAPDGSSGWMVCDDCLRAVLPA